MSKTLPSDQEAARARVAEIGRNDLCPCESGKKYKKCHLVADEAAASPPVAPDPMAHVQNGWRMFEQKRPGAAEKEFKAALALKPDLAAAQVGVGLARLSAGNADGAREALTATVTSGAGILEALRKEGVKDAFNRAEAQPVLRASHALGCLAYDQDRFDDALVDLERVYAVDGGPVGTEARLIAGKTLVKHGRPADAVPVLTEAAASEHGPGRAHMGLALAHFSTGDIAAARAALDKAHESNPHFAAAILGDVRRQIDNPLAAQPGSREEAVVYAQTYGDVWDDKAKELLEAALAEPEEAPAPAPATPEASAGHGG